MKDFFELTKDIWDFLKVRKKYWLAPLIITIVLVGYMLFLAFRIYKDRNANTENNSKKALFQNFYDGFLICFN